MAALAGALAFAVGLVFLIVGRTELFTENFFDPVAATITSPTGRTMPRLASPWSTTLVLNLVGGGVLLAIMTVDGALPSGSADILVKVADEIAAKSWAATLARAVLAGALITALRISAGHRVIVARTSRGGRRREHADAPVDEVGHAVRLPTSSSCDGAPRVDDLQRRDFQWLLMQTAPTR